MHRRHFLATATAAATFGLRAASRAAETATFRVAVIGHTGRGNYGHGLDTLWLHLPQTEIVGVADADATGLQKAQKQLGCALAESDYRKLLEKTKPDIVAVAPRHIDQHAAMILAAIQAGARGIYIEKPFCRTPAEADEILTQAAAHGTRIAIAHRNRYHPCLPIVKKALEDGLIGQPLELRGRGKEDARGGALDLWVLGSHVLNVATVFTGPARAVCGQLMQDGHPCTAAEVRQGDEGVGLIAGNEVHARFETESGLPLFFDSRQNHRKPDGGFGLQIIGTEGIVDLQMDRDPLAHVRLGSPFDPRAASQPWQPITRDGVNQPDSDPDATRRVGNHLAAADDLLLAIEEGREPLCNAAEAAATVEMIQGIFASHVRQGARTELPLTSRDHALAG
ncbi:MAG: Gfo/Idh/MocA family oxidoreductase [Verrucomicrobiales bacterium]|nr:Gfo/Idh/MocA family oxidoreductase [Verrucomicrobiales bacterium]